MSAAPDFVRTEGEDGLRHTALALHAMTAADRVWMLGQLPEHACVQLLALLDELAVLGLPRDRALLAATTMVTATSATHAPKPATDPTQGQLMAQVAALSPDAMVEVLRQEPPIFAVTLMAISAWPWRAEVMQRLGPARARRIAEVSMTFGALPGKARDVAVLEATLAGVAMAHPQSTEHRVRPTAQARRRASWGVAELLRSFSRKAQA
ncbi:hypothetical protein [Ralstonia flaminis]|jgi:hypothetical protein|uniref:DUF2336 domain-containing protein n=1 Tax=Ralstonia flaminis TaxID=3058597 RepID=A0ABM9KB63_9RALS|nr:hypothetical protein [Ralstonia sp. LMG 18101]CAJ0822596.1 hypothetical protein LMG18101_05086 [Ralstonia sp. LMG 18101]